MEEAKLWYETQVKGLGIQFLDELDRAIEAISDKPDTWPAYTHGTRRFLLRRFPYAVIYVNRENLAYVLALAHLKRKPGYWKKRMD